MKQPIHLTIKKELFKMLKIKRANISKYVEKLILKDFAVNNLQLVNSESIINPKNSC